MADEALVQSVRDAALQGSISRIVELLDPCPDRGAAVDLCIELVRELYWKQKNIQAALTAGGAGIAVALTAAERSPAHAGDLQKSARILTYNLASFCWVGWDEPGIALGAAEQAAGRDHAHRHLALVKKYEPDPRTLSAAHWVVGAHHLAAGEYAAAREHFETAATKAREAGSETDILLNQAYAALTDLLEKTTPAARDRFRQLAAAFKGTKDGDGYISQLETAEKVLK